MKVKSLLKIVLGSLILASCALEMEEIPAEELYLRDFIKKYGIIDPNQNWSLASNEVVSVRGAGGAEVKIYVEIKGKRYIVADYKNIADPAALTFDIPSGMEDVIVKVNGKEYPTKVGSTVDASAARSRTRYEYNKNDIIIERLPEEQWLIVGYDKIKGYGEILPEGTVNLHKDNVTQNFLFKAPAKPFKIYPAFWNTNNTNTIGIYIKRPGAAPGIDPNNEDIIKIPFFLNDNKEGVLSYYDGEYKEPYLKEAWDEEGICKEWETYVGDDLSKYTCSHGGEVISIRQREDNKWGYNTYHRIHHDEEMIYPDESLWRTVYRDGDKGTLSSASEGKYFRSKGSSIQLPEGTEFGMYIQVGENSDLFFYSERDRNHDYEPVVSSEGKNTGQVTDMKACHAATFTRDYDSYIRLAFEDWDNIFNNSDMDLNDMIYYIQDLEPTYIEDKDEPEEPDEPLPWTLAVEDLGESDDYDFNDLVLEITHVAGTNEATVKALAAGGIMPIYVKYGDEPIDETHVNQWLGSKDHTVMINTGAGATGTHSTPITITVGENEKIDDIIAKFTIVVKTGEGDEEGTPAEEITKTNHGEVGTTPLMLLLDHDWEWPKERVSIETAYPKFTDWVGNPELDWISSKVEENVIKRQ